MLAQTLNRDFLLAVGEATDTTLRRAVADRKRGLFQAGNPLNEVDTDEINEVAELIRAAVAGEGVERDEGEAEQMGDRPPPPRTDYAYVPREDVLGILQTAFEAAMREEGAVTTDRPAPDDRRSGPLPVVTDERLESIPLRLSPEGRRVFGRMEVADIKILSDPRWAKSVLAMIHRKLYGRVQWNDTPTIHPNPLADDARVVLLGDWGSGLPRAREVAKGIEKVLDDPAHARRDTHVVHLGDVYYSGEKGEYRANFLDPWPVKDRHGGVGSWTLPGNHDMYIGGEGYFQVALEDKRFAAQQRSSWFALANEHWQFLGLDSAYEDGGLYGDQANWIRGMRSDNPGRKTVLLTHHQVFSAYQAGAKDLRLKTRGLREEHPVDAWFWGHEHRCLAYRDLEGVRFASCVGHGGIPEYLHKESLRKPDGLVYEYRKIHSTDWQPWITFGFAVIDLKGPDMTITYIDEDDNTHCVLEHA